MNKSEFRQYIKEHREEELEPSASVKNRLDMALKAKRSRRAIIQMNFYQMIAAAMVLVVAGVGIGHLFDKPQTVVERIVQQVKFVDRPVKEIQYIRVPTAATAQSEPLKKDALPALKAFATSDNDLAVAENDRAQSGISMGDDTILQKMMVTIY